MAQSSTLHSGKRSRDDAEELQKENNAPNALAPTGKKRRTLAVKASKLAELVVAARQSKVPDPYRILPLPTTEWIQLRFTLNRFKGVYRIVQVPTNYTFANLHTLVQYLFGWHGQHTHKTRVYTNVEMYKSANRIGCIKSYGQAPAFPEEFLLHNLSEAMEEAQLHWWNISNSEAAIYEVVAVGKNQGKHKNSRGYFSDYSWHHKVEDNELTLADVWSLDEEKNVSKGEFTNEHIGLIYEYELDCPWGVHITMDDSFYTSDTPANDIYIVAVKGAPSVEEKHHWSSSHPEGCKKTVSDLLLDPMNWKRYCKQELTTRTLSDRLVATVVKTGRMTDAQVKAKQDKLQAAADAIRQKRDEKEKERKRQLRLQRKLEREQEVRRQTVYSEEEYYSD